jgi:hypothetical protein
MFVSIELFEKIAEIGFVVPADPTPTLPLKGREIVVHSA